MVIPKPSVANYLCTIFIVVKIVGISRRPVCICSILTSCRPNKSTLCYNVCGANPNTICSVKKSLKNLFITNKPSLSWKMPYANHITWQRPNLISNKLSLTTHILCIETQIIFDGFTSASYSMSELVNFFPRRRSKCKIITWSCFIQRHQKLPSLKLE